MVLLPFLTALALAAIACCLYVNVGEEMIKVGAGIVAIVCGLLCLFFAPWPVEIPLVVSAIALGRLPSGHFSVSREP